MADTILKSLNKEDLYRLGKAIIDSKKIGFALYREKIIYANDHLCELFGYKKEELEGMPIVSLVHKNLRDKFKKILSERISGKRGQSHYRNVMCIRKDGSYLFLNFTADTVMYEGKPTGFMIIADSTMEKRMLVFYSALKDINHIITESVDVFSLYSNVCKTFVDKYGMKLAWVGEVDDKGSLRPVFVYGDEKEYVDELFVINAQDYEISSMCIKSNELKIVEDVNKCPFINEVVRNLMQKHSLVSACSMPLEKKTKSKAVLSLYTDKNFINNSAYDVLKEIQGDLSFSLGRVDEVQKSITFYEAAKSSDWWFLMTDIDGKILFINEAVEKISGYSRDEIIGQNPRIFKSGLHDKGFYKDLWDRLLKGETVEVVIANRRKDGTIFHIQDKIIPVVLPGNIKRFIAIGRDITKEKELSREAQKLKFEDALTGLLNLNGFIYTVEGKLRSTDLGALILVDISNFSYINRAHGFEFGDKLLKAVAKRLKEEFPLVSCVARIGGDDFGLFVDAFDEKNNIAVLPAKLMETFESPFKINSTEISLSANAGIAIYPTDGRDIRELMEKASITLNRSSKKGKNIALFYSPIADENVQRYIFAESLVDRAVRNSLFFLHYQPYFDSWDNSIFGAEALVRIKDEDGNIYYPNSFIDYLETSRFLRPFEMWLLHEVKEKIKEWKKHVSINISASSFKDEEFINEIIRVCSETGSYLTIEITERTLMSDVKKSRKIIDKLKNIEHPPMISIDDFGTGYASLSMLKEFPIDIVKIDMSFVRNIHNNRKNMSIVIAIIQLTKSLEIKTIAEGVETEEEYNALRTMGADYIQGYYFAKPMPEVMFEEKLKDHLK
ncbi:EAL domain-containing protein [Hippea sp. KM1]|uniref:EAL domain-containing protein n=1 Tax=Hippea sp. KM1 TaxID=944481 RepID=UPI00046D8EB8|nr:EAL domain-containing protein [Hippea sp. KM1]